MVRIYNETFDTLYLAALALFGQGYFDPGYMREYAVEGASKHSSRTYDQARAIIKRTPVPDPKTFFDLLGKVQEQAYDGAGDISIIDHMVKVLQLPYVRSVLSYRHIEQLRDCVLSPSEAAGLQGRLDNIELTCASCARPFADGEMVTIGKERGGAAVYCQYCRNPSVAPCPDCVEGKVDIAGRYAKAFAKLPSCDAHKEVKPAEARPGVAMPQANPARNRRPGRTVIIQRDQQGQPAQTITVGATGGINTTAQIIWEPAPAPPVAPAIDFEEWRRARDAQVNDQLNQTPQPPDPGDPEIRRTLRQWVEATNQGDGERNPFDAETNVATNPGEDR